MQAIHAGLRRPPDVSAATCASALLETTMLVMRSVRRELARRHPVDLSVTQLRALSCVNTFPDASLSDVADFVGLTLPAASRLIASMVGRALVLQRVAPGDRRRAMLRITPRGRAAVQIAVRFTHRYVATMLADLSPQERASIARAMRRVRPLVTPARRHGGLSNAR